jgi:hypothetical protein
MTTEHDNLVEDCARAIQDAHAPGHELNYVALYQARAALAIAIERCAALIEGNIPVFTNQGDGKPYLAPRQDGNRDGLPYAAAIRALLSPNDRGQQ